MRRSKTLAKLRAGKTVMCLKNTFVHPDIVEMMGYLGIDCIWICNEHIGINPESLRNVIRSGRAADTDVMIRRPFGYYDDLIQPLEMGAAGLMIPHCASAAMAREVVRAAKFQPIGKRGVDGVSGDSFFGMTGGREYMEFANRETFIMAQIEDEEAIDEIDAIAAVDGIDIIFVGPADLSHSLGFPGEFKHPKVQDAISKALAAAQKHHKFCGTPGLDDEYTKDLIRRGVKFITYGGDWGLLKKGFSAMRDRFHALEEEVMNEK
jgi:4-hydroxy-2-oxoheptanedioate aldolase